MAAEIIKEIASKTSEAAGDGTTTAAVLAQALIEEGLKNVTAGANPLALKRGIKKGSKAVIDALKNFSKKVAGKEEIAQVATISAEDTELGNLLPR